MDNLPANQQDKFALGPKEQEARLAHREWIGGRVYTLLSHYWREDDDEMLTAALASDWADILQGVPQQYIQSACLSYMREEPRRKPTPGAIYRMAIKAMPRPQVVRSEPEPERSRCSPEEAARIMDAFGFAPRRMADSTE